MQSINKDEILQNYSTLLDMPSRAVPLILPIHIGC